MDLNRLDETRRKIADELYEGHDMGSMEVKDDSGWFYESGARETDWVRPVYLADPESPGSDSLVAHFTVRFAAGSDTVLDSYCILDGELIGTPASISPAP